MKSLEQLFEELGFRRDASDEVKRAFVRNLIKSATANAPIPIVEKSQVPLPEQKSGEQLSFQFTDSHDDKAS